MTLEILINEKIKNININDIMIPENKRYSFAFGSGFYEGYYTLGFVRYIIFLHENGKIKREQIYKLYGSSIGTCAMFMLRAYLDKNNNDLPSYDNMIEQIMDNLYTGFINGKYVINILSECFKGRIKNKKFYEYFNTNTNMYIMEYTNSYFRNMKCINVPQSLENGQFTSNRQMFEYIYHSINNPYLTSPYDSTKFYDSIKMGKINNDEDNLYYINCSLNDSKNSSKYIPYDKREYFLLYLRGFDHAHNFFNKNMIDNKLISNRQLYHQLDYRSWFYYLKYKFVLCCSSFIYVHIPRFFKIKMIEL